MFVVCKIRKKQQQQEQQTDNNYRTEYFSARQTMITEKCN